MPASASARSSSPPAGPTNGRPAWSSRSPGCSPTSMTRAPAPPTPTADDYARAERFLGQYTGPLVLRATANPQWLADGRFWYRANTEDGPRLVLVDPARAHSEPLFDPARLAAALSSASATTVT